MWLGLLNCRRGRAPSLCFAVDPRDRARSRFRQDGRKTSPTPPEFTASRSRQSGSRFTSNGRENTVSIFDLKTLAVSSKVKWGQSGRHTLRSRHQARLHVSTAAVRIRRSSMPEKHRAGHDQAGWQTRVCRQRWQGRRVVNIEDKSELTASIPANSWSNSRGRCSLQGTSGLAMDRKNRRLFAGCDR